jgi:hypothetical protein
MNRPAAVAKRIVAFSRRSKHLHRGTGLRRVPLRLKGEPRTSLPVQHELPVQWSIQNNGQGCRSLAFPRGRRGAVRSSPTEIADQEVETIRARKACRGYAQGLSGSEGSSSCAYVSGSRIGIHMVLVLCRKGAPLRSAFVVATSRRMVKKASLKRGLQRRSGVRVQLPKNSHSRSITGIGTPISQSKSPFPIRRLLECHIR